jgi:neutral ceramidase
MTESKIEKCGLLFSTCIVIILLLAGTAQAQSQGPGIFRAGAARIEITPQPEANGTPPLGKYAHEKLYVRAIVLDNGVTRAVLIGADQINLTQDVWVAASKMIADELKCPVENIVMSGTHSHSARDSAPGVKGLPNTLLDAVRQAKDRLQPARVGFGKGACYLNVNRDVINPKSRLWTQDANPDGPTDKTVSVIKLETPTGEPIAVYANYAMHPVNLYLGGIVSADFPGAMCRYVEQIYDDKAVVIYAQSPMGDQNPLYLRASTVAMLRRGGQKYTGQPLVREEVEAEIREGRRPMVPLDARAADDIEKWIEAEGMVLGEEVLRIMQNMKDFTSEVRLSGATKTITCPGRKRTDKGREGQPGSYADADPVNIRLGLLGIGETAIGMLNADMYTMIGQGVKKRSPLANLILVPFADGGTNSGYIPTDDAYGRYTFQVLSSQLKPGCAETTIQNGLLELLKQYVHPEK